LTINPDNYTALDNKGVVLSALGRKEESIAAHEQAIKIKPDYASAWYNKACFHALSHQLEDALTSLQKALELDDTDKHIELAKTDTDFDSIRNNPQFQALIAQHGSPDE
jgi:tetratricopeptide (TPR) repeat protein